MTTKHNTHTAECNVQKMTAKHTICIKRNGMGGKLLQNTQYAYSRMQWMESDYKTHNTHTAESNWQKMNTKHTILIQCNVIGGK